MCHDAFYCISEYFCILRSENGDWGNPKLVYLLRQVYFTTVRRHIIGQRAIVSAGQWGNSGLDDTSCCRHSSSLDAYNNALILKLLDRFLNWWMKQIRCNTVLLLFAACTSFITENLLHIVPNVAVMTAVRSVYLFEVMLSVCSLCRCWLKPVSTVWNILQSMLHMCSVIVLHSNVKHEAIRVTFLKISRKELEISSYGSFFVPHTSVQARRQSEMFHLNKVLLW